MDRLARPSSPLIASGDPWRMTLRRPVFGTLVLAAVFFLVTAPVKETPSLFDHAPWLNDPFDTVISFMIFLVPLIAVMCVPRLLLCRRSEPLPATRIRDVLRGCRVVLAGVGVTLASEWVSVVIGDNRAAWNGATWLQVGALALLSAATLVVLIGVGRAGLPRSATPADAGAAVDWLVDFLLLARQESRRLGPGRRPALTLLAWSEQRCARQVRRHPLWTAFAFSAVLGVGVGVNQGLREGYYPEVTVMASALLALGMFGLLVMAGAYLGLIRSSTPWRGVRRRLLDAAVVTSVGVLVPFALRYHLWWLVGATNADASLGQLTELLLLSAGMIFAVVLSAESMFGRHPESVQSS
jgi:hypothetical protein